MTTARADVFSYGGGTQTVAICVLIAQGRLPKPERIVMADTGREASETWEYTDTYVRPLLRLLGLEVDIAGHEFATVDLYGKNGDLLLPAFTDTGKLPTFCSTEWKKRVVERWLRQQGYGPARPCQMWLGISTDEAHRAGTSDRAWKQNHYPLLYDVPMRRADCVALVTSAGLPTPPKSSCWMCPYRGSEQWARLRDDYPADFAKAVALDEAIRAVDGNVYLHRSRQPLADALLSTTTTAEEPTLFQGTECDSGYCHS
jgi:hypothetical protein